MVVGLDVVTSVAGLPGVVDSGSVARVVDSWVVDPSVLSEVVSSDGPVRYTKRSAKS